MRIIFSALGIIASLVMLLASCLMNYLFLSSLGKTSMEAHVLGAVSASADSLKALLPFFIAWGWRAGRYSIVIPGIGMWVLFTGFSLLSAFGFSAENRVTIIENQNTLTSQYQRLQSELQDIQARLSWTSSIRTSSIIIQDINRYTQNLRWSTTKHCTNVTLSESRDYCQKYFALRLELASAKEHAKLQDQAKALKEKIDMLQVQGAHKDADPQVSLLSKIFGQSSESIQLALTIVIAVLVELGSSLGLYLSASHGQGRQLPKSSNSISYNTEKEHIMGEIEDFCLACLKAENTSEISLHQAFEYYRVWCNHNHYHSLELDAFSMRFHHVLVKEVGILFSNGKYQGIALSGDET